MKTIINYLGPHSPLGVIPAAMITALLAIIVIAFLIPPLVWAARQIFVPWFTYWLF